MSSSKEYLAFILDQLAGLDGLSSRRMMGEYLLYYRGTLVGGIYDDRFLLKPTKSACDLLRDAAGGLRTDIPYEGAREMLVADIDDGELCCRAVRAIAEDLLAATGGAP